MNPLEQRYNELSKLYRAKGPEDALLVHELFDLKQELENTDRTADLDQVLVRTYSLLGFHQSAFTLFETCADLSVLKNKSRLAVLQDKAVSHQNTFACQDPRLSRECGVPITLCAEDFEATERLNTYVLKDKSCVLFKKQVEPTRFNLMIEQQELSLINWRNLNAFLFKLADYECELIHFHTITFTNYLPQRADTKWYTLLEVFKVRVFARAQGDFFAQMTLGDSFLQDHLLDIHISELGIEGMQYDG